MCELVMYKLNGTFRIEKAVKVERILEEQFYSIEYAIGPITIRGYNQHYGAEN